jgi:nitroreductase
MEFSQVVRSRRMVRSYQPDRPVDPAVIEQLLELAIRAPSAGYSQGWRFAVLATEQARDGFWQATTDPEAEPDSWLRGMRTAPVIVLALSDKAAYLNRYAEADKGWTDRDERRWPVPYWHVDTGMASLLILLGAVDAGLAGCLFGVQPEHQAAVKARFELDPELTIVAAISLGYPAPDRRSPSLRRGRREVSEVTSWR